MTALEDFDYNIKNKNMADNKKSFPLKQTYTQDEQKARYWKCNYTASELQLQYWLILPNDVKPTKIDEVKISDLGIKIIGKYSCVDKKLPYIEVNVAYEHIQYEINAADWLVKKLIMMGEQIIDYKKIYGRSTGTYVDVLTLKEMQDKTNVISRFTVRKDYDYKFAGANYMFVKVSCAEKDYESRALDLYQISNNWNFINLTKWNMAENLQSFKIQYHHNNIEFYYPISWELFMDSTEMNEKNIPHFILRHNEQDKNMGVINLFLYPNYSAKTADEVYTKSIDRILCLKGLKHEIESKKIDKDEIRNPKIKELWYVQGTIDYDKENLHASLMIYIMKIDCGWFYLESISSKPNLQNYNWESSKRCLELIVDSFGNLKFEEES